MHSRKRVLFLILVAVSASSLSDGRIGGSRPLTWQRDPLASDSQHSIALQLGLDPSVLLAPSEWTVVDSPLDDRVKNIYAIYSVAMISDDDGWATTDDRILHYSNAQWSFASNAIAEGLTEIAMISPSEGWASRNDGQMLHFKNHAWTTLSTTATFPLLGIDGMSSLDVWAVGSDILRYNGTSWHAVSNPITNGQLNDIDMVTGLDGWAVGDAGSIIHFNGTEWISTTSPTDFTLMSVDMISSDEGWAVGNGGTIIHYASNAWLPAPSPTSHPLNGVSMISDQEGWAVGEDVVLHYNNGAWRLATNPSPHCPGDDVLTDIQMLSESEGWAVGFCGVILHYASPDSNSRTPQPARIGLALPRVSR